MYLRYGFRRPNFVPKFGASVMGIGPYGDGRRKTGGGTPGRRALRVGAGGFINCPGEPTHSGALAAAGARKWVRNGAETTPKVSINAGQFLSHGLRP